MAPPKVNPAGSRSVSVRFETVSGPRLVTVRKKEKGNVLKTGSVLVNTVFVTAKSACNGRILTVAAAMLFVGLESDGVELVSCAMLVKLPSPAPVAPMLNKYPWPGGMFVMVQ